MTPEQINALLEYVYILERKLDQVNRFEALLDDEHAIGLRVRAGLTDFPWETERYDAR